MEPRRRRPKRCSRRVWPCRLNSIYESITGQKESILLSGEDADEDADGEGDGEGDGAVTSAEKPELLTGDSEYFGEKDKDKDA